MMGSTDQAFAALLDDLSQRGLLDETLVCFVTEFGRTPKLNKFEGRDHWPYAYTIMFAGAGVRGGGVDDGVDTVGRGDRGVLGGHDPQRIDARQLAGVPAHLVGVRHHHPHQLEIPMRGDRPDRRPPHVARPPHHHAIGHGRTVPTRLRT